jgi:soluble lytic murein transglycosylase-like protein
MRGYRLGCIALALGAMALLAPGMARPVDQDGPPVVAACGETHPVVEAAALAYARRYGIPRDLARTIYVQARTADVDPRLVFALVAAESRFDTRAVGRRGERGLLQLRLATARAYDSRVTPEALFHAETNLRLGLLHLKREVEHFDHDWRLGLLAYNMGRGRVTRALEQGSAPASGYATRVLAGLRERPL